MSSIYATNLNPKVATWNDKVKLFEFGQMSLFEENKLEAQRLSKRKLVKKKKKLTIIFLKCYFIKS